MFSLFPTWSSILASSTDFASGLAAFAGLAIIAVSVGVTSAVVAIKFLNRKLNGGIRSIGGGRRGGRRRRR